MSDTRKPRKSRAPRRSKKPKKAAKPLKALQKQTPSKFTRGIAAIGAEGEQRIYDVLTQFFGTERVFCNIYVRRRSGSLTEIDLLAVHPTGVYVVESKNYAGMVVGDGADKMWTHIKGETYARQFYSPVLQNQGHIDALRDACWRKLGIIPPMLSLLVFPDRCDLRISGLPPGLRCCKLEQLNEVLSVTARSVQTALTPCLAQRFASLFKQSQRTELPQSIQAQHLRDVAIARELAGRRR
jgi:hypothetical protein